MNPIRCLAIIPALFLLLGSGNMPRTPAMPDRAAVPSGGSVLIDVLANDGALGTGLELVSLSAGSGQGAGSASIQDGQVLFEAGEVEADTRVRFGYLVRSAEGARALGEVIVTINAPAPVTLSGRVMDAGAGCGVEIEVAGHSVGACSDVDGRFQAVLPASPGDAVVWIRADLPGPTGRTETWRSQPFAFGDLAALGDAAGVVDETAVPGLKLTPYTTVFAAQLSRLSGVEPIADAHDIAWVESLADAAEVLVYGQVINGLLEGIVPLPPGFDNAHALLLDRPALEAFIASLDLDEQMSIFEALESRDDLLAGYPADLSAGDWTARSTLVPGSIETSRSRALGLSLREDGSGELLPWFTAPAASMQWEVVDGVIRLDGVTAIPTERPYVISCPGLSPPAAGSVASEMRADQVRRFVAGHTRDLVTATWFDFLLGEPPEVGEGCELLGFVAETRQRTLVESLVRSEPPAAPSGAWYVDLPAPGWQEGEFDTLGWATGPARSPARFDFATNTLTADGYLPQFQIRAGNSGQLFLDLQEDAQSGGRHIEVELLRQAVDGFEGEEWTLRLSSSDGPGVAHGGLAVRERSDGGSWQLADVVGLWKSGGSASTANTSRDQREWVFFDTPSDPGEPGRRIFTRSGVQPWEQPYSWLFIDGVLEFTTYRVAQSFGDTPVGTLVAECPVDAICFVYFHRTWKPIAAVELAAGGRRLYAAERWLFTPSADAEPQVVADRTYFFDQVDEVGFPDFP